MDFFHLESPERVELIGNYVRPGSLTSGRTSFIGISWTAFTDFGLSRTTSTRFCTDVFFRTSCPRQFPCFFAAFEVRFKGELAEDIFLSYGFLAYTIDVTQ